MLAAAYLGYKPPADVDHLDVTPISPGVVIPKRKKRLAAPANDFRRLIEVTGGKGGAVSWATLTGAGPGERPG